MSMHNVYTQEGSLAREEAGHRGKEEEKKGGRQEGGAVGRKAERRKGGVLGPKHGNAVPMLKHNLT